MPLLASGVALLALALQGAPAPVPLPVTVYPVLGHGRDSLAAVRLTRAVATAFRADSAFVVVPPRRVRGSRVPQPRYGVVAELRAFPAGRLRLAVRIVDIPGVYLVARDSLGGSAAAIERGLPALAHRTALRLDMLQWPVFSSGPPPSWTIPTDALRLYAHGLEAADRGDTSAAIASLQGALQRYPHYREACHALRRFGADAPCPP